MGRCLDRLDETERNEVTALVAEPTAKKIGILINRYKLCPSCALYAMMCAMFLGLRKHTDDKVDVDDVLPVIFGAVSAAFEVEIIAVQNNEIEQQFRQFAERFLMKRNGKETLH